MQATTKQKQYLISLARKLSTRDNIRTDDQLKAIIEEREGIDLVTITKEEISPLISKYKGKVNRHARGLGITL
jgi:hypothetical protein